MEALEHDKHNSRNSNQILLNDKKRKYSLWIADQGRRLRSTIALFAQIDWIGL